MYCFNEHETSYEHCNKYNNCQIDTLASPEAFDLLFSVWTDVPS